MPAQVMCVVYVFAVCNGDSYYCMCFAFHNVLMPCSDLSNCPLEGLHAEEEIFIQ